MTEDITAQPTFIEQAAEIIGAYVAHNSVPATELPNLLRSVHDTLASLGRPAPAEAPSELLRPAVPVKKSVTDEFIISLEDGRKFKSLKRYLSGLGMTPAEYRAKWSLPADYPMVAPAYSNARSALAKAMQFGRKRAPAASEAMPVSQPEPQPDPVETALAETPKKRGRAKKAA